MFRSRNSFLSNHDGKASFEPQEFLAEDFSVDEFIQNKRTRVPLDVLRDDLGSHLKFLRSSLIELINQDYGQFVNLSSNLVGLDGRIQNIAGPLQKAKNDLNVYVSSLDSNIDSLRQELEKKKRIRQTKRQLQLHRMALLAVESSEKHMHKVPLNLDISSDADFRSLSLSCEEIANAQFLVHNCQTSPMSSGTKKRLETLLEDALSRMNQLFQIHSVKSSSDKSEFIVMTLMQLYVELQQISEAERIFTLNILKPVCDEILSKKGNISSLLDEVENFLSNSPTIAVSRQLESYIWMAGYDFLTNCVLPHIVGILKKHFPHIWSPSNPDTFHSNWIRCEKFIMFMEDIMPSTKHLEVFRESEVLKEFISKWQFPVYFQLRFHALAIELESALDDVTAPCANSDFKLDSTRVMVKVLSQCWDSDKIYISHISGRFLKASALIISRYINAVQTEVTSKDDMAITVLLSIYCDLKLAELILQQMISEKLQSHVSQHSTEPSSPSEIGLPVIAKSFFQDFQWQQARDYVENRLVQVIVNQSSSSISIVTEIPRLYRRTNRDLPTKHGDYVEGILQPIVTLQDAIHRYHQGELWDSIGFKICDQVSQRYKIQVEEVLTSVLRMEESLKRLKKVKGQSAIASDNNRVLSDDDKIRRQIQIDINHFTAQIQVLSQSVDTSSLINLFERTNGTS